MVTGTAQSTVYVTDRWSLVDTASTTLAFSGLTAVVKETECDPGVRHVTAYSPDTLVEAPTVSPSASKVRWVGATDTPEPGVAVCVTSPSIGWSGPRLVTVAATVAVVAEPTTPRRLPVALVDVTAR